MRVRNSDIQKGKSSGYRLVYYVKTATGIILLTVYTKSEQVDISAKDIQSILTEYEQRLIRDEENIQTTVRNCQNRSGEGDRGR